MTAKTKQQTKTMLTALFLAGISLLLCIPMKSSAQNNSAVPQEYFANYKVQNDWNKVADYFVQINASIKMGEDPGSDIFKELNTRFQRLFPNFPQEYSYKIVYQQCLSLSNMLAGEHTYAEVIGFMDNCYTQLNKITDQINTKLTVKANATRNPASGAAPLTVTFDARSSTDPSNETIPSKNFYRYYRDTRGIDRVIGIGPVLSYAFEEDGNYVVHLTVRSSNANSEGIFDGEKSFSIDVAPKAANINVYANGKKLTKDKPTKIGVQEASKGVLIDGSATIPMGGRQILSHKWEVTSREGFKYNLDGDGKPGYINIPLTSQGEYKVKLTTFDNENNTVSEIFSISISDPVAIIKQTPIQGNTSTTFTFDAAASYSLTSRIRLYVREIYNDKGDKIETIQGKNIKKQFIKPGMYTVKLTVEDELGQLNIDTMEVYAESSDPVPQFTISPTNKRAYPSEFYLDASPTSDIDVTNGYDSLEYQRSFSNPNATEITSTKDDNQKVTVVFNEVGDHIVTLTAIDKYGKLSEIKKTIKVTSTLRPELFISPNAVTRGKEVSFSVKSNKPIVSYEWNFGDGDSRNLQTNTISHTYAKIGVYNITVRVTDDNGNSNEVTSKVFIGEIDYPIAAYKIITSKGFGLQDNDVCEVTEDGSKVTYSAYKIDRLDQFQIDPSNSVNAKGTSAGLAFYFQPQNDEIYKQSAFSYKFNRMGCQYIDFTTEDTSLGKISQERIWFKVVNALPTLKNIVLSFPQYSNQSGIGFQQNNVNNIYNSNTEAGSTEPDPLIVKVSAQGATDSDGSLSYFKWYYYPKDNPYKIIETRITPSTIPYTFFSIPRMAGEYMFGVAMYDSDDGSQKSEDIIGNGPTVFFPPETKNSDIPIVTLRTNAQSVNVGDEVTFDVIAKIMSERNDFDTEKTISYDFDGDGTWDLITKKDRVTHTYTLPNEKGYTPRAEVSYRGYVGAADGNSVVVKNGVKPQLLYNTLGTKVIFRDLTIGDLIYRQLCFDTKSCAAGNNKPKTTHFAQYDPTGLKKTEETPITKNSTFIREYDSLGPYEVSINVKSQQGISASGIYNLNLTNNLNNGRITSGVNLITIPEASFNNKDPEIFVGKQVGNSILFYLNFEGTGTCYIDKDISIDEDRDGKSDNDQDILCNQPRLITYEPQFESTIGRIYFTSNGKTVFKNFSVNFMDFEDVMNAETKQVYNEISSLINSIEDGRSRGNADLKTLLDILRKNLINPNQTSSNIVSIQNLLNEGGIYLDEEQTIKLEDIISKLSNASTIAAMGETDYNTQKEIILATLPSGLSQEVAMIFKRYESAGTPEEWASILEEIANLILSKQAKDSNGSIKSDEIDPNDISKTLFPALCKIAEGQDVSLSDNICKHSGDVSLENSQPSQPITQPSNGMPGWLKVILRIIGGGIVVVIVIISFFALRARFKNEGEDETEEDEETSA